jgi:hypothetical protein
VCRHSGAQDLKVLASFKALVVGLTMFSTMFVIRQIALFVRNASVRFCESLCMNRLIFVKETDCFICDAGTEVVNVHLG